MDRLVQAIEMVRQKLPGLRRHCLKETPTRTIVIDPLLEALGWDVRDPDEVQLEYPTIDGKFVDYALKLNRKPVLLVEAKALGDSLEDVKAITQVVGYAANGGIVWCILTNGIKWRVYRSMEKCPAPDKLMFEVSLDPDASENMTVEQVATQMWRFSCKEMARGVLDDLGERTFTDGRVRKTLQTLMIDPPRGFLNLIRRETADKSLTSQQVKESLIRIAGETGTGGKPVESDESARREARTSDESHRSRGAKKAWETRRAGKGNRSYDEAHHLTGKPQEAVSLYRSIDRLCMSLVPSGISRRFLARYINYERGKRVFCRVCILRGGLIVRLRLKYSDINDPPAFARDVSNYHHGAVGFELRISNSAELAEAAELIRRSFESVA